MRRTCGRKKKATTSMHMPACRWCSTRLLLMLHYHKQGRISLEKIAQKMSHAVADCFRIRERGYIREGYWADLVIVDLGSNTEVTGESPVL
jgi:dihydroorotase-like cyclic amidohydrolase